MIFHLIIISLKLQKNPKNRMILGLFCNLFLVYFINHQQVFERSILFFLVVSFDKEA